MKTSFYKKSCRWLVMLVAMFAVSLSSMAQEPDATFDCTSATTETIGKVTYSQTSGYDPSAGINLWGGNKFTITTTADIEKIVLRDLSPYAFINVGTSEGSGHFDGVYSAERGYGLAQVIWIADAGCQRVSFTNGVSDADFYVKYVDVYLVSEGPSDPITYTVNFTGTVPEGCSASYGEDTFTTNGSTFEVAKNLKKEDLVINTTADYYADVDYNAVDHTYTVEFKHWYTYNVVITGHQMGALHYDNAYYGDDNLVFKSKTVVDENEFSAYPLTRYDAAINVESTGDYTYTVTVKYTAYPTLSINASAQDGDGNYWTTFSFNKPVSLPKDITPYIVTGVEDELITVVELEKSLENKTTEFNGSQNHDIVNNTLTGGDVTINTGYLTYYPYYGEFYQYGDADITISVPEGGKINSISFDGDGNYTNPTWPDGSRAWTYTPSSATNSVSVHLANYYDYVYFYGITVNYDIPSVPVIPANTGVLLKSETAASNIQYEVKENAENTADVTGNLLVAAGAPDYNWNDASKTYYKFSLNGANEEGSVGFYWQVAGGHSLTPNANKAYLVLDGTANVRGFRLDGKTDATEGIFNALNGEEEAGAVFNLNGQRVNGKPAAGVYVKNGRKFIVK